MIDDVLQRYHDHDSFAAIEFLNHQNDPLAVLETYNELAGHVYNELKNVPLMVVLACAGIQYGLLRAAAETDSGAAAEIKGRVKAIAYNLAANTWPGWDDPGIVITRSDSAIGLDAARANLRLGRELERGDLPMSRAYWMLGAQLIAAQRYDDAQRAFADAARLAASAGEPAEGVLAKGFSALVDVLQGGADAPLNALKAQLVDFEHGAMFVGQIDSARRVFSRLA
jgi:hypothetical protein